MYRKKRRRQKNDERKRRRRQKNNERKRRRIRKVTGGGKDYRRKH